MQTACNDRRGDRVEPTERCAKDLLFSRIEGEGRESLVRAALALALQKRREDPGFDQFAMWSSAFGLCACAVGALLALGGEAALREQKAKIFLQPPNA